MVSTARTLYDSQTNAKGGVYLLQDVAEGVRQFESAAVLSVAAAQPVEAAVL
jgi:hypothetical protein